MKSGACLTFFTTGVSFSTAGALERCWLGDRLTLRRKERLSGVSDPILRVASEVRREAFSVFLLEEGAARSPHARSLWVGALS